MHSLCYRTDVLRESNLPMPPHTFYVDNINAYVPLPRCKTMYYADIDLYRYFIGREGQSVNEATMVKRLDQQFRVTRIMMESYHLYSDVGSSRLRSYMMGYFTMMMVTDVSECNVSVGDLAKQMDAAGQEMGLSIRVQREDIFQAKHRV